MRCKADNNTFDLGFATTPKMSLDIESLKRRVKVENISLENSSQESCNQLTLEKGYHGNSLKELDCFLASWQTRDQMCCCQLYISLSVFLKIN
jgi:hypothetical protein